MKKKMKKKELEINRALEYVCARPTWRMRNVLVRDLAWKLMKSRHKRILPRHSTHTHTSRKDTKPHYAYALHAKQAQKFRRRQTSRKQVADRHN